MTCTRVQIPGGGVAIVCGPKKRAKRCSCGGTATLLCDWKVKGKKSGTCDQGLCERCTHVPAPDKDLCPKHAAAWEFRLAAKERGR